MNEKEARQFALVLFEESEAVFVSTVDDDGFPQTRAMCNLRNKKQFPAFAEVLAPDRDGFVVYLATVTSSPKMRQIRKNPAVAAYFCAPASFHGLMLGGKVEVVEDPAVKKRLWDESWRGYYPAGPEDPEYALLRLAPTVAKGWHGPAGFEFSLAEAG